MMLGPGPNASGRRRGYCSGAAATIREAAGRGDVASLKACAAALAAAPAQQPPQLTSPFGSGSTPLHLAAAGGHIAAIGFLLDSCDVMPADIDAENASGLTPFMCAVLSRQLDAAMLLAARGADVSRRAACGSSALALLEARTAATAPELWADACSRLVEAGALPSDLRKPLGCYGQQQLVTAVSAAAWRRRRHAVLARHAALHDDA